MLTTLAFRHLLVRKLRSLFLLFGFALGVGVMIVLLSVGEAMLEQSRDVSLVGGGELTILPQGIDVEAMRTGGLSGMYFGIDRARFLTRQTLGGSRQGDIVRSVSPSLEGKLLYLRHRGRTVAVRAGAEIPSRAAAVNAGIDVRSGSWHDLPADSAYITPTRQQLYDELDRFHLPSRPDSTWGEWHYFNVVLGPDEWWYVTYLIGGDVPQGDWGGQLLVTHRRPDGKYERFNVPVSRQWIRFDTTRADLTLGENWVRQRNGSYQLRARARVPSGPLRIDLNLVPAPNGYFPPVVLRDDELFSGYVVPALQATASGRICVGSRCRAFDAVPAYHDHNWGVWRDVTWEWGAARGSRLGLLYGGIYGPERARDAEEANISSPFFLTIVDSLGVRQVLRFSRIDYQGSQRVSGHDSVKAPQRFSLVASRQADTARLDVRVLDALATGMSATKFRRVFLQMRGEFELSGRVGGQPVADSGTGFFETYIPLREH
ncbi:MAG TPA: ABC transporter permease [Gemmatimonadales bacterium]